MRKIDMTGQRFGRLTVINQSENRNGEITWLCKCDCGNEVSVKGVNLRKGITRSCGCLRREVAKDRHITHGMRDSRLYQIWSTMLKRCDNPKSISYKNYGARGITVCEEWKQFEPFMEWAIENGYQDHLTIDRIDNDGNYCPDNCRWSSVKEQANNRRTCRFINYNGKTQTMKQWAEETGIRMGTLYRRLVYLNWSVEKALTAKVRKMKHG